MGKSIGNENVQLLGKRLNTFSKHYDIFSLLFLLQTAVAVQDIANIPINVPEVLPFLPGMVLHRETQYMYLDHLFNL